MKSIQSDTDSLFSPDTDATYAGGRDDRVTKLLLEEAMRGLEDLRAGRTADAREVLAELLALRSTRA
ncbi:MAG: hypothetical protein RJB26_2259 [Pseudomonadota bacterium]|jgi:hypothetical protein